MAFLDNSGDIILDAVLTELGRRRLAQATVGGGNGARITSWCLGDDEIQYTEYDLNHPSGSNYADLEILQTPILEAFTAANASINYGLLNISNNNLLYLPSLNVNSLSNASLPTHTARSNIYYCAVNTTTRNTLINTEGLSSNQVATTFGQQGPYLFVEGGLNSTEITKDLANRQAYIASKGISNPTYDISVEERIVNNVLANNSVGTFSNNPNTGADNRKGFTVSNAFAYNSQTAYGMAAYRTYRAGSVKNQVVTPAQNGPASLLSTISGPGDTVTCYKIITKTSLNTDGVAGGPRDILYDQIGSVGVTSTTLFGGGSRTYSYIDTFVYVRGTTTGNSINIPMRIIRRET